MKDVLSDQTLWVLEALEKAGYEAYVVGGCVRDYLMNKLPHDIDITTSATPDEMKTVFGDSVVAETGICHGTLSVCVEGEWFEITTYRIDGKYEDNRHPKDVLFSNKLEDDLSRRDFTVNAMAYKPKRGLVDRFGGQAHIQEKIISTVGDAEIRFHEDGLRILRALRFASVLDFSLDEKTVNALHSCKILLKNIAAERIFSEMNAFLLGKSAGKILQTFSDVFSILFHELAPMVGFEQRTPYHCYDVFLHTIQALDAAIPDSDVRWAILFHDGGKPACYYRDEEGDHFKGHGKISAEIATRVLSRLKADKATINRVKFLVLYHDANVFSDEVKIKRLLAERSPEDVGKLLEVQKADGAAHAPAARNRFGDFSNMTERLQRVVASNPCVKVKNLALSGHDLANLGVPRGKSMGMILQTLLDGVIEGKCENTKESLRAYFNRIEKSSL